MPAWKHAIALGTLLSACGSPATPQRPDFVVHDTLVYVHSDATFARRADLPARVESTIEAALTYWGGSWEELAGRSVTLEGAALVACDGVPSASGCFDGDIRVSTSDLGTTFSCVEQTELVHEVGHAVIGDAAHLDPRWMDFTPVADALGGRVGYADEAEVDCPIVVGVWRHPPRH